MAKVIKVAPQDWAKHLRPYLKRKFWKRVRAQARAETKERD